MMIIINIIFIIPIPSPWVNIKSYIHFLACQNRFKTNIVLKIFESQHREWIWTDLSFSALSFAIWWSQDLRGFLALSLPIMADPVLIIQAQAAGEEIGRRRGRFRA
jgi:hypothetical protein